MGFFSRMENKMEDTIEGAADKMISAPISPVQIAKQCEKQMKRNKMVGAGKQIAPTLYTVLVNEDDDNHLFGYYPTLAGETETYLIARAHEMGLSLDGKPLVRFIADPALKHGKFDVIAECVASPIVARLREEELARYGFNRPASQNFKADRGRSAVRSTRNNRSLQSYEADPYDTYDENDEYGEYGNFNNYTTRDANSGFANQYDTPRNGNSPYTDDGLSDANDFGGFDVPATEMPVQNIGVNTPGAAGIAATGAAAGMTAAGTAAGMGAAAGAAGAAGSAGAAAGMGAAAGVAGAAGAAAGTNAAQRSPMNLPQAQPLRATLTERATGKSFTLSAANIKLGRETDNDIVIADMGASRYHATITRGQDCWIITDQNSTNGTLVNGREVNSIALRNGDTITIGTTEYIFDQAR